jgi:SAM-dependent methyltransferase
MEPITAYSTKAAHYARHRWRYAGEAIQALIGIAQIGPQSVVADVGAGTGILSKQLVDLCPVERLYAIEPNEQMRRIACEQLATSLSCTVLKGRGEAIPLPDQSVNLIAVAQAIHWFEPEAARAEFRRITKPGGRLALLRNYGTDEALNRALAALMVAENGVDAEHAARRPESKPPRFYLSGDPRPAQTFPFVLDEPWEAFIGSLCSASFTPDETHRLYPRFEREAHAVFERFAVEGQLRVRGETELLVGRV